MITKPPNPSARIFLAGNLGYLENLIAKYGGNASIQEIYTKEKEKSNEAS